MENSNQKKKRESLMTGFPSPFSQLKTLNTCDRTEATALICVFFLQKFSKIYFVFDEHLPSKWPPLGRKNVSFPAEKKTQRVSVFTILFCVKQHNHLIKPNCFP